MSTSPNNWHPRIFECSNRPHAHFLLVFTGTRQGFIQITTASPTSSHCSPDPTTIEHTYTQAGCPKEAFVCRGECTLEPFFPDEGYPKIAQATIEKKALFPYLDVESMNEADKIDFECRLKLEARKIKMEFAKLTSNVMQSLETVPLKQVKISLLSLESFTDDIGVKVLDEEDAEKIKVAKDLLDIFFTLRKYISFFNYHIIEYIIEQHKLTRDPLNEYLKEFRTFCQRSVFEVPENLFQSIPELTGKVFAVKCTKGVTTMNGVDALQEKIATTFSLRSAALQLCSIKKGCVELHFLISAAVADRIFPVSSSQCSALSEIGVRVLSCEGVEQNSREETK